MKHSTERLCFGKTVFCTHSGSWREKIRKMLLWEHTLPAPGTLSSSAPMAGQDATRGKSGIGPYSSAFLLDSHRPGDKSLGTQLCHLNPRDLVRASRLRPLCMEGKEEAPPGGKSSHLLQTGAATTVHKPGLQVVPFTSTQMPSLCFSPVSDMGSYRFLTLSRSCTE